MFGLGRHKSYINKEGYCHPTKSGHKEMAKLWLAELKKLLTEEN